MNREFECMMYLFSCAALGENAQKWDDVNYNLVIKNSFRQNCFMPVIYAISQSDEISACCSNFSKQLENEKAFVVFNVVRYEVLIKITQSLDEHNIKYAIMKGYSAGKVYSEPFVRTSGDIDILVGREQEKAAGSIFKEYGFVLKNPRVGEMCVSEWHSKIYGIIELHTSPFVKKVAKLWMNTDESNCLTGEKFVKETVDGRSFYVLGINDRLTTLFAHLYKHFVNSGLSVQTILDFVLTYIKYRIEIDFDKFWRIIDNSGLRLFCNTIFTFAVKHLYIKKELIEDYNPVEDKYTDMALSSQSLMILRMPTV